MLIDYPKDGKIDDELWDETHCFRVIVFQQLLNMEVKEFNKCILAKIKLNHDYFLNKLIILELCMQYKITKIIVVN